ncbi:putative sugar kinase [Nymphon striatum]|nr:putative sugar kinase [Nymphon striatum]
MKYHVYGIGNALVDKEFEVSDSFLAENGIEKELAVDQLQIPIVAVSQLGGKTFYACKVADDETGDFYMKDLAEAGVKTKLDQIKGDGITGKCLVMVTDDAERTMNTYLGITSDFSVDDLHIEDLKNSEYLYIEGYLVTSDVSRNAAIEARKIAKQNNVKTAFTFSDPAMVTLLQRRKDAISVLQNLADKIVVTLGSKGAKIISKDKSVDIEASKVTAIDTNGAGDMFAGAFMYGLTQGMSDRDSGMLASESAARTVATFGARLEKEVLQGVLAKYID